MTGVMFTDDVISSTISFVWNNEHDLDSKWPAGALPIMTFGLCAPGCRGKCDFWSVVSW